MQSIQLIHTHIKENTPFAVLVGGDNCSVCHALRPRLEKAFRTEFSAVPFYYLKIETIGELAGQWMVFSVPTFLLFVEGSEMIRKSGVFSLQLLLQELARQYSRMNH